MTDMPNITEEKLDQVDPEEIVKIKLQLQEINDTLQGGLRSANMKEYRNTYVINAQDSLDANYPLYVHFNIIPEMVKIVSINVSFWFLNFRAYSTAAAEKAAVTSGASSAESSGASSASSSASGGASTPTTSNGGATTPTSSSGGGQTSSSGGGQTTSATGSASGGGSTSGAGNPGVNLTAWTTNAGDANVNGYLVSSTQSHTHITPNHTHPTHTHTVANHTHTVANHTHTVSIPNHTHTVTIGNHTHNIEHTHNIPHTHTVPAHTHDLTFGIFEEETSATVIPFISKDNGLTYSLPLGSYSEDHENIDITDKISGAGSKMLKFTSNARTRISVQITVKLDISAR